MSFLIARIIIKPRLLSTVVLFLMAAGASAASPASSSVNATQCPTEADPCIRLAEDLFRTGFWDEAVTEYLRYLYWRPKGDHRPLCQARLAACWENLGDLGQALDICLMGAKESQSSSVQNEFKLKAGELYFQMGQEAASIGIAGQVMARNPDPGQHLQARIIQIRSKLSQHRFAEVRADLEVLVGEMEKHFDLQPGDAEGMRQALRGVSLKSEHKAGVLSKFIPGSGQLYAGNLGRAVNAAAINCGLAIFLLKPVRAGDVGLGVLSSYLLRRYYYGNSRNAERTCRERNRSEIEPIANAILEKAKRTIGPNGELFQANFF